MERGELWGGEHGGARGKLHVCGTYKIRKKGGAQAVDYNVLPLARTRLSYSDLLADRTLLLALVSTKPDRDSLAFPSSTQPPM